MEHYSKIYAVIREFTRFYHNRFWYKKIEIRGYDTLPKDTPMIFTPNHQNALMDAAAVVYSIKKQVVFLARADIFNSKTIHTILSNMRILPIYRMRDGASSLGKNEEIFDTTVRVLKNNAPLALFPEAMHWGFRKLKPIKKGVPRIAFLAEERYDFKLNIVILPIGIYYDEYKEFRKSVFVNFGKPIKVADFKDAYLENENYGYQELRKAIESGMKEVMLHIQTNEFYEDVEHIRTIVSYQACIKNGGNPNKMADIFDTDRKTIAQLDELIESDRTAFLSMKDTADKYLNLIRKMKIGQWIITEGAIKPMKLIMLFIAGIILSPLVVIGLASHLPMKLIIDGLVKKTVKDPQFVRSFRFGIGYFLLPIGYYFSLLIVSYFYDFHWGIWTAAFFSLPIFGVIAHEYIQTAKRWLQTIKFRLGICISKQDKQQAEELHRSLLDKLTY